MPEPTTVVCPNCGTPAEAGTQFCASCGAELPTLDEPPANGAAPRAWWIVGGVALALIIAGIVAFLLLGNDDSVTTDEPDGVETSLPATTTESTTTQPATTEQQPATTEPGDGGTTAAPAPTTESPSTTTAAPAPTAAPKPAPSTGPEPAPTDRSEEAAGLIGEAIENCGGLGFVDTIVGSPTGDDNFYKVKARFVWDDSDPFTASYTVDVDSGSITAADSESAYLACL